MISEILHTLESGLKVIQSNSKFFLIAVLLFVFPLLFVWITQGFFVTSHDNIETVQKQKIGILHDSLATIIDNNIKYDKTVAELIDTYISDNTDVTKIRVVKRDETGFKILHANDQKLIGSYEISDDLYRSLSLSTDQESHIVKLSISGTRVWQVFRAANSSEGEVVIFSEHSFSQIDSVMAARKQQSYLGLTAIFIFLISLAYWLSKQMNWQREHKMLVQQLHERDLFSNMIAHEFRSPLTAIKGYASFLEESKTISNDEHRFASNIRASAERLVVLVNDFLEVARVQSGKVKIAKNEVDIRTVLETVASDLSGMASEKGLVLTHQKNLKPVLMQTDSDRMTQVLTNIITNAIKYTDEGSVTIESIYKPGEVIVRVKDTGTGISAEDQQKLFSPFTRVGGVDDSAITGSGLGMWITKQLVELLGGTVGVESIKGIGTHIVISFKT